MTNVPVSEHVSVVGPPGQELPGELTPVQKLLIELGRKQMIRGKLNSCMQALIIIRGHIKNYTASGNPRKLAIYQAKEQECLKKIEEYEKMLVPKDIAGAGGE